MGGFWDSMFLPQSGVAHALRTLTFITYCIQKQLKIQLMNES